MGTRRMLDKKTLDDIIRRIVEVAQPEKIILFGSAARGRMGPHSDVDLLIIKEGADALDLMARIYRKLHGVRLLSVKNTRAREFYETEPCAGVWSRSPA